MFGFLKKLFGTKPTVNPCDDAPYKVEAPATVVNDQITDAVTAPAVALPIDAPAEKPKKKAAPKKAASEKKPVPKITGAKRGRKPKAK